MDENEYYNSLTPSQKKLLKDIEMWMKDTGVDYTTERTRIDAIYDIKKQFPTERKAREAVESGGHPDVLYLYYHDKIKKSRKKKKNLIKSKRK